MNDRRLIEEAMPLKEISVESAREKSIRHGHVSTLHIWWARRPLVACRATILGSLLRDPGNEEGRKKMLDFIVKFCTWEASNDAKLGEEARRFILEHNGGEPIKILDCFAGGGAIPLEALRVGCEAHALELNPVAVLIELCTLVYPQKYGKSIDVSSGQRTLEGENKKTVSNRLAYDVERWGHWVLEEARKEIGRFYPEDADGSKTVVYLWSRTVKCPNPKCGAEIPLVRTRWLSRKSNTLAALRMVGDRKNKCVDFEVAEGEKIDFDPREGTVKKGSANCPVCKEGTLKSKQLRSLAQSGKMGSRLFAVVLTKKGEEGKKFRVATIDDSEVFEQAQDALNKIVNIEGSIRLPDEPIATPSEFGPNNISHAFFVHLQPVLYGLTTWGSLFNSRQALALLTFAKKVKEAYGKILEECGDKDYAIAVTDYLALALGRLADYMSSLTRWAGDFIAHTFGRQAIEWIWDYPELNPFSGATGDWRGALNWIIRVIENISHVRKHGIVQQGTATRLPYPDKFFEAIITDPPYYDNIPYSDLSDFFYVWLKRTVGHLHPDMFATPLTPKSPEIIQNSSLVRKVSLSQVSSIEMTKKGIKDKEFFEREMTKTFREMHRVLKPNGVCMIVFAHKTTTAWETLITALLNTGFRVTSSWPLRTERPGRLRAIESAALASSVWLVCRKRSPDAGAASWKNVQAELDGRVKERLNFFLSQGIKGADALLSAIGPALEVFGRYEKVEKVTGDTVTTAEFLDKVREVVAYHALSTVLSEQELGKVDTLTSFYVLWKWTFEPIVQMIQAPIGEENEEPGKKTSNGPKILIPFDDALKLARSVGAEIETLLKARLLKQEKEYVRMLSPVDRKDIHALGETARDGTPATIIDMVHRALMLWESQEHGKLDKYLQTSGAVTNETFWRVAQALSNLLPLQSREKQLLDGLLARHAGGVSETGRHPEDKTLDEFMIKKVK